MPNIGISQLWRTLRQLQRLIAYGISFTNKSALENGQRCHGLIVQDETMLVSVPGTQLPNSSIKGDGVRVFLADAAFAEQLTCGVSHHG